MLPQQWSNPDYCYLEPSSRVKPEQSHQMAVSTNHNLSGHVIQLISLLSDVKTTGGFRVIAPFKQTITTFRFVEPEDDILRQLRQQIDNDIESLYEIVAQQGRRHMICMTTDLQQNGAPLETAPW